MDAMKSIAAFALVAALVIAASRAAEPTTKPADEFVRPYAIVGLSTSATESEKAAAKEIADAIGSTALSPMDRNPTCCVWIEISRWTPNPGEPGYFIINQGGGSIISASNEEQLRKAIARFKKSIRKTSNGVEVPAGMMTNYRIVTTPAAE